MYDPFPSTYTEITPGKGIHFFFKIPDGVIIQQETGAFADIFGRDDKGKSLSGIDIITKGVPIAPTMIISRSVGRAYEPIENVSLNNIAPAPDWLVNLLLKTARNKDSIPTRSKTGTAKIRYDCSRRWRR